MKILLKLEVPLTAPSLNQWYSGKHWGQRKKIADRWHEEIYYFCKQQKVKPITKFPVEVVSQVYFKRKGRRDASNYGTAIKLVEDGLVKAKIIPDDSGEYISKITSLAPIGGAKEDKTIILIKGE